METPKTFVLGLGAQKSATSWLYQYLSTAPCADFGLSKEYHIWDDVSRQEANMAKAPFDFGLRRLFQRVPIQGISLPKPMSLRMIFLEHRELYFAYFNDLLTRGDTTLTGDITPSYANISLADLQTIRDEFANRGIAVKPIFVMRDPVYRALSAVRMHLNKDARAAGTKTRSWTAAQEIMALEEMVGSPTDRVRACYDKTIENSHAAFGKDGVFIRLYEDMFHEGITADLSAFLNQNLPPAPIESVHFSRATEHILPQADYDRLRAHYAPMIDRVRALTGFDVDTKWAFRPGG